MAKLVNMKARTVQQKKLAVERWLEKSPRDLPAERVYLSEELQKAQQLATLNASAKVYAPVSIQDQDEITRAALAHINRDKTVLKPLAPVSYAESAAMIMNAPSREELEQQRPSSNSQDGMPVFKEIPKDNSDLPFKKWRSAQPDNLGERQESEEENVSIMSSDSPSIAD